MQAARIATPTASLVADMLEEYGTATRVALAQYLGPREPYRHLYQLVGDYPRRGGRMLRPSLCIASACAFGAQQPDALRVAVALELLHNAFLVHDDIEDESETRRGAPTLHRLHGVATAVNVGDALTLMGLRALIDSRWRLGTRVTFHLLEEAERMARESVEGQAIELGWRRDNALHLTDGDYLEMVLKKTCWYTTIFPLRAGAVLGSGSDRHLDRFLRYGFLLGAAFQIQDDVLNLIGHPADYGKEQAGDLWEGKRTLPLLHLLRSVDNAERTRLRDFLAMSRSERGAADVAWVRERMDAYHCVAYASNVAHALAGAAHHEGSALLHRVPPSRDRQFLENLPGWLLARTRRAHDAP